MISSRSFFHIALALLGLGLLLTLPDIVLADIPKPNYVLGTGAESSLDPASTRSFFLNSFIPKVINFLLGIISLGSFATLIWSSFRMLTAWGNETALENAKNGVKFSIIGLLLSIFAYAIVALVANMALPTEEGETSSQGGGVKSSFEWVLGESVYASATVDLLLPSQESMIQNSNNEQDEGAQVVLSSGDLFTEIIPSVLSYFYYAIGFIIFVSLSYAAGRMVLSRGDEEALTFAKEVLLYSCIGAVLAGLSFALVTGLGNLNFERDKTNPADSIFPATNLNTNLQ